MASAKDFSLSAEQESSVSYALADMTVVNRVKSGEGSEPRGRRSQIEVWLHYKLGM